MDIPERIGKYTISEVLGQGAMGVVYKGFDPHIRRPVAIKVVHKELLGDSDADDSIAARFRNEAQAVGRIAHSGVVAIYEFGEDDENAFIVMEYVPGRNLDEVLKATPLLAEPELLRIMDQLLSALAVAHKHGVWHRDIKPANLILTASGQVKITDFGIARIEHAGLTQVSSMIGTPGYMAPEQYMGEGIDHRADLFACGALLYRLLTGKKAFSGTSEKIMYKILNEQPPAVSVASDGRRSSAYDAVVERALAKLPAARFASAEGMRQAVLAAGGGLPATASVADSEDATVMVHPATPPRPVESPMPTIDRPSGSVPAGAVSGTPMASMTSMTSMTAPTGWDPLELSRIERALATHIGPMARLMVRKAAVACGDVVSLATAVSVHIAEPAKRQQFMSVATAGSQAQPKTAAGGTGATPLPSAATATKGTTGTSGAAPVKAVSDEFKAGALQVMVRRMGPISRVLIKRAGEQCGGDRGRFIQLLVESAAEADRPALLRDLTGLA